MDALPAVLAGIMFYPLCRFYGVDFDKPFVVLSILAATATLAVLPPRNTTSQVISGRLELATNLLMRWAVLVAALLALGYVTKYSEVYSRRVVVTWVLVTPVLLVLLSLVAAVGDARAADGRRAGAARHRRRLHRRRSMELTRRLARHNELGIAVAGFFDDRGSDRLRLRRSRAAARALLRRRRVRQQPQHRRDLHRDPAGAGERACASWWTSSATPRRPSTTCRTCSGFDMIQQRTSEILGFPVVAMCETPFHGYRGLVKRLMDVTLASARRSCCCRRCC